MRKKGKMIVSKYLGASFSNSKSIMSQIITKVGNKKKERNLKNGWLITFLLRFKKILAAESEINRTIKDSSTSVRRGM